MKQWWGPKGFTVIASKMDLRVGGTYHYGMKAPDGSPMWGKFVFREIVPPETHGLHQLVLRRSRRHHAASDGTGLAAGNALDASPSRNSRAARPSSRSAGRRTTRRPKSSKTFDTNHDSMRRAGAERWSSSKPIWPRPAESLGPKRQIKRRTHMAYVDGFVVPVPKKKLPAYRSMAQARRARSGAITARWNSARASPTTSRSASGRRSRAASSSSAARRWCSPRSSTSRASIAIACIAKVMKDKRLAEDDEPQGDAVRRQAHDLRRVQDTGRSVTGTEEENFMLKIFGIHRGRAGRRGRRRSGSSRDQARHVPGAALDGHQGAAGENLPADQRSARAGALVAVREEETQR